MTDEKSRPRSINRRTLCATLFSGATVAIAGCGDNVEDDSENTGDENDDTESGPVEGAAQFGEVTIEPSDNLTADSDIPITLSARNVGGETGSFTDTLFFETTGGAEGTEILHEEMVAIEDVQPDEVESTEHTIPAVDYAGEYRVKLTETEETDRIEIGPIVNEVDSIFTLDNDLRLRMTDVSYECGVFYEYSESSGSIDRTGLQTPLTDQVYVLYSFAVENAGTTANDIDINSFEAKNGEQLTSVSGRDLSTVVEFEGPPLESVSLNAGESTKAWTMLQYDRSQTTDGVELRYQRDELGSTPEAVWRDNPHDSGEITLPEFELVDVDMPIEAEIMEELTFEFTIENSGDLTGEFRGLVQRRDVGTDDWINWTPLSATIEPGVQTTIEVYDSRESLSHVEYRLKPFDVEREVKYVTAQRGSDESFTTPGGLEITPVEYVESDTIETEGLGIIGEFEESGDSSRFVTVGIELHRPTQSADDSTVRQSFSLVTAQDAVYPELLDNLAEYSHPVEGPTINAEEVNVGDDLVAYISFELQNEVMISDTRLRWKENGTVVEWEGPTSVDKQ